MTQGDAANDSSSLPVFAAMSSGQAKYIFAAYMKASHVRMLIFDLRFYLHT